MTRRLATKRRDADRRRLLHETKAARPRPEDAERETQRRLEVQRELTDAVLALPEPYRTVVTLRFFDGLPPRAIAKRTGAGSDVARQQLRRGLAMLRARLDRGLGSRRAWLAKFVSLGFGSAPLPLLTLSVLTMNKLTVAVAALAVGGVQLRAPRPGSLRLRAANTWPQSEKGVTIVAIVTRVDAPQPPYRIWGPERDDEDELHRLVPGSYRVDLVEQHGYGDEAADVPLGLSAEVTVRVDEVATATLR